MTLERRMDEVLESNPGLFRRPHPLFPDEKDRVFWDDVATEFVNAGSPGASAGDPPSGDAWPDLPASLFRDFRLNGDRARYEDRHFLRRILLGDMIIEGVLRPKSTDAEKLIDALWSVCEESFWGLPAHNAVAGVEAPDLCDPDEPIVDLFAAETAALLAWAVRLKGPTLEAESPLAVRRVLKEADRRVVRPFLERDDFWWMGESLAQGQRLNNWTPWIVSNVLTVVLLLERFDPVRTDTVAKACRILDRFLAEYGPDGGCDEGPGYWTKAGAALFDSLDLLLRASGGTFDAFSEPLVREIGRFIMKMHIAGDYYVNFADGPAKVEHAPGELIRRFADRIQDESLRAFGDPLAARQRNAARFGDVPESLLRRLHRITAPGPGENPTPRPSNPPHGESSAERPAETPPHGESSSAAPLQYWLPDIQVMAARTGPNPESGLFLACKGGHNEENHNHNDVGNFIVYADGRPLIADAGVGTYTAKTFSDRRYEIWTMRSSYHNLPEICGREQQPGRGHAARDVECRLSAGEAAISMELADAYPEDAGIISLRRSARLFRDRAENGAVVVTDAFRLAEEVDELTWFLVTPAMPGPLGSGSLVLTPPAGDPRILEISGNLVMTTEELDVSDEFLSASWPDGLRRLRFSLRTPAKEGIVGFRLAHHSPSASDA